MNIAILVVSTVCYENMYNAYARNSFICNKTKTRQEKHFQSYLNKYKNVHLFCI